MSTIPSALIQSTMNKVKNEMSQLEHWLLSLQESSTVPTQSTNTILYEKLDQLLKELEAQRHTIHHLMDRIEVLESRDDHNVHIEDQSADEPWFDHSSAPLQNMIIDPTESHYHILKTDNPSVQEILLDPVSTPLAPAPTPNIQSEPAKELPVLELAPVKEEVQESKQVVKEVEPKEEPKEEPTVEEEEEEEEQEEEDDQELEAIEFKGVTYCKDQEGFVYSLDEEGSPSDQPIGIWKEKTKSVAFYRKA